MRGGFLAFGLSIVLASLATWRDKPWVRTATLVFGLGMVAAGIWSNAPILPDLARDMGEDRAHSVASAVVGTAFAAACLGRILGPGGSRRDALSWIALIVSVLVPVLMAMAPDIRGLLQRGMFGVSFLFMLREFSDPAERRPPGQGRHGTG